MKDMHFLVYVRSLAIIHLRLLIGEVSGMLAGQRQVSDKVRDTTAMHGHAAAARPSLMLACPDAEPIPERPEDPDPTRIDPMTRFSLGASDGAAFDGP
jgi:hypothetical protein